MKNKNIWLLPTKQKSKLYLDNTTLHLDNNVFGYGNQNSYITNLEKPKYGDWVFDTFKNACPVIKQLTTEEEVLDIQKTELKIILTDNKDLIKDGVQSIPDEFLEFIVKNPSCENVEVKEVYFNGSSYYDANQLSEQEKKLYSYLKEYKIIIPQEEPKQVWEQIIETCGDKEAFMESAGLKPKKEIKLIDGFIPTSFFEKQETLEEVASNLAIKSVKEYMRTFPSCNNTFDYRKGFEEGFIEFSKWQQQRSYSEEEVLPIIEYIQWILKKIDKGNTPEEIVELILFEREKIEQFKKK